MKVAINYKSVVAIGGFNPSILTPDFLRQCCGFNFKQKPEGQTTPVLTNVKFGNLQFMMELNKFQIVVEQVQDFKTKPPLDLMVKYLKVLKYTPVILLGVNFNYDLAGLSVARLEDVLRDPFGAGESLRINPTSIEFKAEKPDGGGLKITSFTAGSQMDRKIKNTLRIEFKMDHVTINNNFEVDGLMKDRNRVRLLMERHDGLVANNDQLLALLGGL